MAFGVLNYSNSATGTSVTSANDISLPSIAVSVGDLVYGVFIEQTSLTVTSASDNLGNVYTALNAGTDAGAVTARAFYSRITHAGALTRTRFAATASSNEWIALVAIFGGLVGALDQNPANITSDITSPFLCPPTGVLAQADELVVAWGAANYIVAWGATSPMLGAIEENIGAVLKGMLASKVVAATTTTTPAFTAASNPTQAILATSTFRKAIVETVAVTQATVTFTGKTVTISNVVTQIVSVTNAAVALTGKTVEIRESDLIPVAKAVVTLTGKTVALVNTSSSLSVVAVDKADVAVVGKAVALSDNLIVGKATVVITGKAVVISGAIPVTRATVVFTGGTVTSSTSTFQRIPKYIIRGRGSRHEIKGRGSRVHLVTR